MICWNQFNKRTIVKQIQLQKNPRSCCARISFAPFNVKTNQSTRMEEVHHQGSHFFGLTKFSDISSFFHYYRPQTKFAKVMFLHLSVILFTGGAPGQVPPGRVHLPGRYHPQSSACWEIRATSGWYASYWNAFVFLKYDFRSGFEYKCANLFEFHLNKKLIISIILQISKP